MSAFKDNKKRDAQARESKRHEILEAYHNLVAKEGFENASMSKIAKEAGIPASLIFHYFENKQDLIYALIDYVLESCIESSVPGIHYNNDDAQGEFSKFIDEILDIDMRYQVDPRVYYACNNMAMRDAVVGKKFLEHYSKSRILLEQALQYFFDRGVIAYDNVKLASGVLMTILGGLEEVHDFGGEANDDMQLIEECKRILYHYFRFRQIG